MVYVLPSTTILNLLNGNNAAAYGSHGRWEIIQWQSAVENPDGTFRLTKLARGRRGSDFNINTHKTRDRFIMLSNTTLQNLSVGAGELNAAAYF